jgi:integrase
MTIDPKRDPARRCRPVDLWPAPDRAAWEAAMLQGDVLEPGGEGAHWSLHSRRKIAAGYGRWLTWLDTRELLGLERGPATRITPDRVRDYVADIRLLNAPYTVLARVQELYQAIHAMVPAEDWRWLCRIENNVRHTAVSVRNKRSRIVSAETLAAFGLDLMTRADLPSHQTPLKRASQFRDGLMIALLAARPLRRRNFMDIEIGRHLVQNGDSYWLRFDGPETKTGEPIEAPVPQTLAPFLERYLSEYQPFLLQRHGRWKTRSPRAAPDRALWVSARATAMTEMTAYGNICRLTKARFGHPVNPHLFRDSAATSVAIEDPEHVHIVRSLLGHSTMESSERHYIHAQTLQASRRYQQQIVKLRQSYRRHPRQSAEH